VLALDRRSASFDVARVGWTVVFAALAAVLGGSAAIGYPTGMAAAIFVTILGWLVVYWRVGVVFLLVLSSVDGFLKYLHGSLSTYVLKDVTMLAVILGIAAHFALNPKALRSQRWTGAWLVLAYMAFLFVEIFNPGASKPAAVAGFRAHAFFCSLFFVGAVFFSTSRALSRTALVSIGAITFACIIGIVQYAVGPAWNELGPGFLAASRHFVSEGAPALFVTQQANAVVSRVYGTLVDPTAMGLAATFGILFALGQLIAVRRASLRIGLGAAIFVMVVALLLSGTRAAIGAAGVGFLSLVVILAFRRETRRYVFFALLVAIVAVPLGLSVSGTTDSGRFTTRSTQLALATRQRSASLVFRAIESQPFGVGLGGAGAGGKIRKQQHIKGLAVDNLYLATLYETGPLGLGLLATMQIGILVLTIRAARRAGSVGVSATFAAMGAAQIAMLVAGTLNQGSLDYAPVAQMFWLFAGAIAMPERLNDTPPAIVEPATPRTVVPLRERFPRRLRAIAGGLHTAARTIVPARPISEAEIDAALDRFRAHMRANLTATSALGAFASRDTDELLRLASRKLFASLKKAIAEADADPVSAEKARRVVHESAEIASLMLALSEKYER
jgi:hypothetical protein